MEQEFDAEQINMPATSSGRIVFDLLGNCMVGYCFVAFYHRVARGTRKRSRDAPKRNRSLFSPSLFFLSVSLSFSSSLFASRNRISPVASGIK